MYRLAWVCALLGACGSTTDDRPPTLEYITETIFIPSCASAECHSAFKRQVGDAFDSVANARRSLVANSLVLPEQQDDPDSTYLMRTLTVGTQSLLDPADGNVRMPYDAPLPDADIELIRAWISSGMPGARCTPNDDGLGCSIARGADGERVYKVVECIDGNFGAEIETCGAGERCTFDSGNGRCVAP